jgi:mannose-6-phosphate isomerase
MSLHAALIVEPQEHELIWGGHALVARYGKTGDPRAKIGESWECWDENRIESGDFAGKTIAELRAELGRALVGGLDPSRTFPVLTKFIDAREALSVQVHPDDAYARRVEHQPNGKTECWYVLEAEPGASIVLGWNRDTSRGEYLERVKDGSLGDLLRHVEVKPHDVFYLPAGTLHAIGAGIVLFETQQASDLTYRIFDYNRLGADGKPRQLNVDKAADVLDYYRSEAGALRNVRYSLDGLERSTLVADHNFILERVDVDDELRGLDLEGMPLAVLALDKPVELESRGTWVRLDPYQTALVPAEIDVVMVRSVGASGALLTAAPPHDAEALARRFARAAVPVGQSSAFFAQFS